MLRATAIDKSLLAGLSPERRRLVLARAHDSKEIREALSGPSKQYNVSRLGSGGCAEVLGLHCKDSGDTFAVKKPRKKDELYRKTIEREGRISRQLPDHKGLVRFFGYCPHTETPILAMEALRGIRLSSLFRTLSLEDYLETIAIVADSVVAAHNKGIVHADLKSENVIITDRGPVTIDFGLSGEIGEKRDRIGGTPEIVPPEAFRKQPFDPSLDVYALGRMLEDRCRAKELILPKEAVGARAIADFHRNRAPIPEVNDRGEEIPMSLVLLVGLAVDPNPSERITATQFRDALLGHLDQN
ncbi:protein kinase [Candidatus Micrarchaeota archaeon]|nr:protein kinase [Candidatus Micrarchaeota archaeon]